VRRSSFASHLRSKHPEIRHLVTKEFLDSLQGPRALKPRNMRGIHRSATAPHILTGATGWEPRASSSVTLPTLMRGEKVESPESSSTLVRENDYHLRNTSKVFLWFLWSRSHFIHCRSWRLVCWSNTSTSRVDSRAQPEATRVSTTGLRNSRA